MHVFAQSCGMLLSVRSPALRSAAAGWQQLTKPAALGRTGGIRWAVHVTQPRNSPPQPGDENRQGGSPAEGKLRRMWRQYGWVSVGTYFTVRHNGAAGVHGMCAVTKCVARLQVYAATLGTTYAALNSGMLAAVNVVDMVGAVGLGNWVDVSKIDPRAGSFTLAWVITKLTEPLRLAVTLAITPTVAKRLRARRERKDGDGDRRL